MKSRGKTPKFGASVFAAAIAVSIGVCAGAPGAYADEMVAVEAGGDFIPGSDRAYSLDDGRLRSEAHAPRAEVVPLRPQVLEADSGVHLA